MQTADQFIFVILTILMGMTIPVQSCLNSVLGKAVANPVVTTIFVFLIATLFLIVVAILTKAELPQLEQLKGLPTYAWMGGLLGSLYVVTLIYVVPKIGVGFSTILVVCGQILMGVIFDHFGAFGMPQIKFSLMRALAVLMISASIGILQFAK